MNCNIISVLLLIIMALLIYYLVNNREGFQEPVQQPGYGTDQWIYGQFPSEDTSYAVAAVGSMSQDSTASDVSISPNAAPNELSGDVEEPVDLVSMSNLTPEQQFDQLMADWDAFGYGLYGQFISNSQFTSEDMSSDMSDAVATFEHGTDSQVASSSSSSPASLSSFDDSSKKTAKGLTTDQCNKYKSDCLLEDQSVNADQMLKQHGNVCYTGKGCSTPNLCETWNTENKKCWDYPLLKKHCPDKCNEQCNLDLDKNCFDENIFTACPTQCNTRCDNMPIDKCFDENIYTTCPTQCEIRCDNLDKKQCADKNIFAKCPTECNRQSITNLRGNFKTHTHEMRMKPPK